MSSLRSSCPGYKDTAEVYRWDSLGVVWLPSVVIIDNISGI